MTNPPPDFTVETLSRALRHLPPRPLLLVPPEHFDAALAAVAALPPDVITPKVLEHTGITEPILALPLDQPQIASLYNGQRGLREGPR